MRQGAAGRLTQLLSSLASKLGVEDMKRETPRGSVRSALLAVLLVASGCGGDSTPAPAGPVFTSLSQTSAVWTLSGTFASKCNNVPQSQILTGIKIYVLNGQFNAATITLPTPVCGVGSVKFQGAIDLDGKIMGNFATNGGSPVLTDVFSGTCSTGSCSGATNASPLFTFTLTKTAQNVFDGTTWYVYISCVGTPASRYGTNVGMPYYIPILNGSFSVSNIHTMVHCDPGGGVVEATPANASLMGSVNSSGDLTGTLIQIAGPDITLSGAFTSPTAAVTSGSSANLGTTAGVTMTWAR
jgi:hypothetical protein